MVHSGNVGGGEINAEWRDLGDIQGPWALKTVQVESKEHCRQVGFGETRQSSSA